MVLTGLFSMPSRNILTGCSRLLNITSAQSVKLSTNASANIPDDLIRQKFKQFMNWYEDFTGLKDVRLAQEKVLRAQDNFINVQETRRDLNRQLAVVRDRLKEIYSELDQTTRGEDKYVLLITQEHKVLKEERKLLNQFNQCEQEERENFSVLTSAVKESHEKERIQAERTKYWSIIGSVIGTILGVAGSSINNELKMRELRKLVQDSSLADKSYNYSETLKEISSISKDLHCTVQKFLKEGLVPQYLKKVEDHNNIIERQILDLQNIIQEKSFISADVSVINVEKLLDDRKKEYRLFAFIAVVATCSFFVLSQIRS